MNRRCEWCGLEKGDDMTAHFVEAFGGSLTNPFRDREPQFLVCSDPCKEKAEEYYSQYRKNVGKWAVGFVGIFGLAFACALVWGYPVFRWAMPAAIGLGGLWMIRYPYANSFRRDKSGSLKTCLRRSLSDGKVAGILFIVIALVLAYINTTLPASFVIISLE